MVIIVFISVFLGSRGVDMHKIVRSFSSDTGLNDVLVHAYVRRRAYSADFERYMNSHCASWNFNYKQLASFLDIIVFISVFFVVEMCIVIVMC